MLNVVNSVTIEIGFFSAITVIIALITLIISIIALKYTIKRDFDKKFNEKAERRDVENIRGELNLKASTEQLKNSEKYIGEHFTASIEEIKTLIEYGQKNVDSRFNDIHKLIEAIT